MGITINIEGLVSRGRSNNSMLGRGGGFEPLLEPLLAPLTSIISVPNILSTLATPVLVVHEALHGEGQPRRPRTIFEISPTQPNGEKTNHALMILELGPKREIFAKGCWKQLSRCTELFSKCNCFCFMTRGWRLS